MPKPLKEIIHKGNIYGIYPSLNTYQGTKGKAEIWSAIVEEFKILPDKKIWFWFKWEGYKYIATVSPINETNYQGRAIADGEEGAKIYLTLFANSKGYLLTGTWDEENYRYDILIDVTTIK